MGNGWPVWQCTRCLRTLPMADGGRALETHLQFFRYWPTQEDVRITRLVLGPDALPPLPRPILPTTDPQSSTGRGSLTTCGDVEPNPGPFATDPREALQPVPAPGHSASGPRHLGALHPAAGSARPDPLVVHTVWHVLAGSAGLTYLPAWMRPHGRPPHRCHQSWLRYRQLVIGKRSPEYQALRSAGLAGAGTATPRIDQPCPGREWGRRYYASRHNHHRLGAIDQALFAPTFPKSEGPRTWAHGRCRSCPARLDHPPIGRGASLLSCGEVAANPGPPPTDWGEEDYTVVPDLVAEACGRLGDSPVREAFAAPANHRFPSYWTKEDDAFGQP